jgi:DNA-binding HxlR family transcriptional regulator
VMRARDNAPRRDADPRPSHEGPGRHRDHGQNRVPEAPLPDAARGIAEALQHVGDRWTLLVIAALLERPLRFGELQRSVPGVATNVLSSRLKELERRGLVVTEPYSTRPVRLEYHATERAAELGGVLRLLHSWAASGAGAEPSAHSACGTPLEVRHWCPTCQQIVDEDEEIWV